MSRRVKVSRIHLHNGLQRDNQKRRKVRWLLESSKQEGDVRFRKWKDESKKLCWPIKRWVSLQPGEPKEELSSPLLSQTARRSVSRNQSQVCARSETAKVYWRSPVCQIQHLVPEITVSFKSLYQALLRAVLLDNHQFTNENNTGSQKWDELPMLKEYIVKRVNNPTNIHYNNTDYGKQWRPKRYRSCHRFQTQIWSLSSSLSSFHRCFTCL